MSSGESMRLRWAERMQTTAVGAKVARRSAAWTKGGLYAMQLLPEDMPKPARPRDDDGGQCALFEYAESA